MVQVKYEGIAQSFCGNQFLSDLWQYLSWNIILQQVGRWKEFLPLEKRADLYPSVRSIYLQLSMSMGISQLGISQPHSVAPLGRAAQGTLCTASSYCFIVQVGKLCFSPIGTLLSCHVEELCQAKLSTGKQSKASRFFAVLSKSCVITCVIKSIRPSTRPSFPN